jgi:hypothetical protein
VIQGWRNFRAGFLAAAAAAVLLSAGAAVAVAEDASGVPAELLPLELPSAAAPPAASAPAAVPEESAPATTPASANGSDDGKTAYPSIDTGSLPYGQGQGQSSSAAPGAAESPAAAQTDSTAYDVLFRSRADRASAEAEYQRLKAALPRLLSDVGWDVRETEGQGFRLVLGPIPGRTAASQLCYAAAKLAGQLCETVPAP